MGKKRIATAGRRPRKQRLKVRLGKGLLMTLSLLFLASAALRLTTGTGAAIAREMGGILHDGEHDESAVSLGGQCAPEPEIANLLKALNAREAAVKSRESAVSEEMLALSRARQEIAAEMEALRDAETELEATLALADGAAENDLSQLTGVYEAMKPKDAAALFQEMDPKFAAGFLGRMQSARAAAVLAGMDPKAAYTISLILAGRNGSVPTD
ncbi:hypothetical protein [Vannielia sp.]|uniref:MotE family protein n=1 Tax=Vannielia sp. TaxID=2813045 RepID=UPI002605B494|nr:hypothetical protein [Vannielia sp.]MDF1871723.1 hypothetical protein [Vannielia sp.]